MSQRLSNAKEVANRSSTGLQSHEDLAKKLQVTIGSDFDYNI